MTEESVSLPNLEVANADEGPTASASAAVAAGASKDEIERTILDDDQKSECSLRSEEDVARSVLEVEADAFTRFIERQRIEVMYELRRLRLGERPVTGQPNRERIETFLHDVQQQNQEGQVRSPSTRPMVPSAHVADINALSNRRCVTAALSSTAFRQDLESAIRRSVVVAPMPMSTIPTVPQASSLPRTMTPIDVPPQRPVPVVDRSPATLNVARQERELQAWDTITQLQRELIVLEISDLVHRQLVSTALESDFRTHLEQNVLTRLERGAPQENIQETPTVAPTRPVAVAATSTATNLSASTVEALTARLDGMQQMLQLMFSMQLDMQRSLRQEVASAIANSASSLSLSSSEPIDAGHCTVCLTAMADTVLYRCGHLCVCYMCGLRLRETKSPTPITCPICRAPVDDIVRVYRSSRDGQ